MISKKSFTTKKKRFYSWMIPPFVDIFPIGKGGLPAMLVYQRVCFLVPWKGVWFPGRVYGSLEGCIVPPHLRGRKSWSDWTPYHATVTARSIGRSFFGANKVICLLSMW